MVCKCLICSSTRSISTFCHWNLFSRTSASSSKITSEVSSRISPSRAMLSKRRGAPPKFRAEQKMFVSKVAENTYRLRSTRRARTTSETCSSVMPDARPYSLPRSSVACHERSRRRSRSSLAATSFTEMPSDAAIGSNSASRSGGRYVLLPLVATVLLYRATLLLKRYGPAAPFPPAFSWYLPLSPLDPKTPGAHPSCHLLSSGVGESRDDPLMS